MKEIRKATEDEMLLCFLKGEIESIRFKDDLASAMEKAGFSENVILKGDTCNAEENDLRKLVMKYFRGYPDREIFEDYPTAIDWSLVELEPGDLDKLLYIDYCYWNELSDNTGKPSVGAENVLAGRTVYDVPNDNFYRAAEYLERGKFAPLILLCSDYEKFLILEGHVRATAYGMKPDRLAGSLAYVGLSAETDLAKKDSRWKKCL